MIQLTQHERDMKPLWLKHVLAAAVKSDVENFYAYNTNYVDYEPFRQLYKLMCSLDVSKFNEIDTLIATVSGLEFSDVRFGRINDGHKYALKNEEIANILASVFSQDIRCYWNDSDYTVQERKYFKKSLIGKALLGFDAFVSGTNLDNIDGSNTASSTAKSTASTPSTANQTSARSGSAATLNQAQFRSLSSKDAYGMLTQPGQMIPLSNYPTRMVCIIDVSRRKNNKDCSAIIRPFIQSNVTNGKNAVIFTNNTNYGDCKCYFSSDTDADAFIENLKAAGYQGQLIKKLDSQNAKWHGFYEFDTAYGKVIVKASHLNEELFREELEAEGDDIINFTSGSYYNDEYVEELTANIRELTEFLD